MQFMSTIRSKRRTNSCPLNADLKKGKPKQFESLSTEETDTLATLQQSPTAKPVLALPHSEGHLALDPDACTKQLGCDLIHNQVEVAMKPLGYWSRAHIVAEQSFNTGHRECLGVIWSTLLLRPYLEGQRLTICTDHDSLQWIHNLDDSPEKLAKWRLCLSEFDFEEIHIPRNKNQGSDALSRLETEGTYKTLPEDGIHKLKVSWVQITKPHNYEQDGRSAKKYCLCESCNFTTGEPQNTSAEVTAIVRATHISTYRWKNLQLWKSSLRNPCILDRPAPIDGTLKNFFRVTLRARILYRSHYPILAVNRREKPMYNIIQQHFRRPDMANDVHTFVQ